MEFDAIPDGRMPMQVHRDCDCGLDYHNPVADGLRFWVVGVCRIPQKPKRQPQQAVQGRRYLDADGGGVHCRHDLWVILGNYSVARRHWEETNAVPLS